MARIGPTMGTKPLWSLFFFKKKEKEEEIIGGVVFVCRVNNDSAACHLDK
jgi:hypothetical protein